MTSSKDKKSVRVYFGQTLLLESISYSKPAIVLRNLLEGVELSADPSTSSQKIKERQPTQKTTHPNRNSVHKQFAQTLPKLFVQTVLLFGWVAVVWGGFQKGGIGGYSPVPKTGTRVHSMFSCTKSRNEGTFAKTALLRNRPELLSLDAPT